MGTNEINPEWPTRLLALQFAAGLVDGCCHGCAADQLADLLNAAESINAWLIGTTQIKLTAGPAVDQLTGQSTGTDIGRNPMQIHDNEKFNLAVNTEDAKGFETADAVTWAEDQNGAVITLTVADDGRSCEVVAVAPGSAVVTVTDATANLSATESVDVVAGGTATIAFVEGAVEQQ